MITLKVEYTEHHNETPSVNFSVMLHMGLPAFLSLSLSLSLSLYIYIYIYIKHMYTHI